MPKILKTTKKRKNHGKMYAYIISALKGLLIFVAGIFILGLLLLKSSEDSLFYFIASYVVIALGGFVSGYSGYKALRGRGFINGISTAGLYICAVFIIITAFMRFEINTNILLIVPIGLLSGFIGGTVGANI